MIQKLVSYYSDTNHTAVAEADRLFMEIGNSELAFMVKGGESMQIKAFELYELDKEAGDWPDIFFELRALSRILDRSYAETHCFFNFREALIIPENKFSISAAEDFLSLVYGESTRDDVKHDTIHAGEKMVNAYRIKKTLHEWVGRQFILYQPHHTYTQILSGLFSKEIRVIPFVKLQVYKEHMIAAVTKDGKLQLIQSFSYQTEDDILYHIMNINKQFNIHNNAADLEISGRIQTDSVLFRQLSTLFSDISAESIDPAVSAAFLSTNYPAHFFTPFYKLTV